MPRKVWQHTHYVVNALCQRGSLKPYNAAVEERILDSGRCLEMETMRRLARRRC